MGTNYYVGKKCACCGHVSDERLHIGKSSAGWKFLFAPYPDLGLTSWREWREYLAKNGGADILDEYGDPISFPALVYMVEAKQKPEDLDAENANAAQWGPTPKHERVKYETFDAEGYRFSTTDDFS